MEILIPPVDINPRVCDECPEDCISVTCWYTPCTCYDGGSYAPGCDLDCSGQYNF